MSLRVQLCQAQLSKMEDAGAKFESDLVAAGVEVEKFGCLGLCFGCGQHTIARIEGAPISAKSPDALVAEVRAAVAA